MLDKSAEREYNVRVFKDECGQVLTSDELLLEFLHLDAKKETDCKDILEYINQCTGKDGTLTEYEVPQYDDIVMLNSLISEDERLKEWYNGEPLTVSLVDLQEWKFWVSGYLYPIPMEFATVLVKAK